MVMKIKILSLVTAVVVIAALIFGYAQMSKERAADAQADQPVVAASHVQTDTNGETVFALDAKTQALIGLKTATLAAATLPPEIKAYGRVLDSAALVGLKNDAAAAHAAAQASQAEYERQKKLSAENNASARTLETAEADLVRNQSALANATAQLAAASGAAVAGQPPEFFQSLARQESVVVRLDVPAGELAAPDAGGGAIDFAGSRAAGDREFSGSRRDDRSANAGRGFSVSGHQRAAAAGARPGAHRFSANARRTAARRDRAGRRRRALGRARVDLRSNRRNQFRAA